MSIMFRSGGIQSQTNPAALPKPEKHVRCSGTKMNLPLRKRADLDMRESCMILSLRRLTNPKTEDSCFSRKEQSTCCAEKVLLVSAKKCGFGSSVMIRKHAAYTRTRGEGPNDESTRSANGERQHKCKERTRVGFENSRSGSKSRLILSVAKNEHGSNVQSSS